MESNVTFRYCAVETLSDVDRHWFVWVWVFIGMKMFVQVFSIVMSLWVCSDLEKLRQKIWKVNVQIDAVYSTFKGHFCSFICIPTTSTPTPNFITWWWCKVDAGYLYRQASCFSDKSINSINQASPWLVCCLQSATELKANKQTNYLSDSPHSHTALSLTFGLSFIRLPLALFSFNHRPSNHLHTYNHAIIKSFKPCEYQMKVQSFIYSEAELITLM